MKVILRTTMEEIDNTIEKYGDKILRIELTYEEFKEVRNSLVKRVWREVEHHPEVTAAIFNIKDPLLRGSFITYKNVGLLRPWGE